MGPRPVGAGAPAVAISRNSVIYGTTVIGLGAVWMGGLF